MTAGVVEPLTKAGVVEMGLSTFAKLAWVNWARESFTRGTRANTHRRLFLGLQAARTASQIGTYPPLNRRFATRENIADARKAKYGHCAPTVAGNEI